MPQWSARYSQLSEQRELKPVYVLMILSEYTYARPSDTVLEGAVGRTETAIQLPSDKVFNITSGDDLIIYDKGGWEMIRAASWNSGTQNIATVDRAQFSTTARDFDRGAVVGKPLVTFSTSAVAGTTWPIRTGMQFPTGGGQTIDMRDGRNQWDEVTVTVLDKDSDFPRVFKSRAANGLRAIVMAGYEGMNWQDYSFLWVGSISNLDIDLGVSYTFSIDCILSQLKVELFGDIEDFSATLTSNITSGSTTFGLSPDASTAYLNSGSMAAYPGGAWGSGPATHIAGIAYKIDSEWILGIGGSGTTISVATDGRGYIGTTAASHTAGAAIDMAFVIETHPVAFILGLLLTKQTDTDSLSYRYTAPGSFYWDWATVVDQDRSPIGIGMELGDVDADSFHAIRERWFSDYIFRYVITTREKMESFIPEKLLKPLGLALYVNRAGQLGLMIMEPPVTGEDMPQLTTADIIGIPKITHSNDLIVNQAKANFDYDGSDFLDYALVIDSESQVNYQRKDQIDLDCLGMDSDWRADSIAPRVARRKIRPIKDANPIVSLDVLTHRSNLEIGSVVRLTHPDLPDLYAGAKGWDKLVLIVGKQVDWQNGSLRFDVIDTRYFGKRYGLIAPSGTVDFTSASDATKLAYAFIADGTTEKMSDNTPAYMVT